MPITKKNLYISSVNQISNNVTSSIGAFQLVGDDEISGAAGTTISFTGLDLDTDVHYRLYFRWDNARAGAENVSLFWNNDTNQANYSKQGCTFNDNVVGASRGANAQLFYCSAQNENCVGVVDLFQDVDGYGRAFYQYGRSNSVIHVVGSLYWASTTNLTSLYLTSDNASSMNVGTRATLYKVRI